MKIISLVVVRATVYRSDDSHTDKKAKGGMMPTVQKENGKAFGTYGVPCRGVWTAGSKFCPAVAVTVLVNYHVLFEITERWALE